MRGKCGLMIGFAVGYVLGTRAGRERYHQIVKVAGAVWESTPAQKLRAKTKGFVGDRAQAAQNYVVGKGRQIVHAATAPKRGDAGHAPESETAL